jgi:hypothetical protein
MISFLAHVSWWMWIIVGLVTFYLWMYLEIVRNLVQKICLVCNTSFEPIKGGVDHSYNFKGPTCYGCLEKNKQK